MKITNPFNHLFWYLDSTKLDLNKDRNLIVHQVLAYGTLEDMRRLIKLYGKEIVRKEFKKPKAGLYQPSILNFVQHVLGVAKIDQRKYLKKVYENLSRSFR